MNEKEFEKQQLEQLLNDLKDIDKYTSFKNGAFIYDLGKYQGSLLVNHINNLQSKIDKAFELLQLLHYKFKDEDSIHNEIEEIQKVLKKGKIKMTYKKMWEHLKEYIHEAYNGENEIETVMEQIEDMYFKKENVIEELIKEVSK